MANEQDTNISIELTPPNSPEEAIGIIAKHADQLEQVALNLGKAISYIPGHKQMELSGYAVKERTSYDFIIMHNEKPLYNEGNSRDNYGLATRAEKLANHDLTKLSSDIAKIGELAHIVHLDKKELQRDDVATLAELPARLEEAKKVLETVIQTHRATPEQKDDLIQFKRDAKFLEKFIQEIGNAGEVLVEHNKQLVDRQSELLTTEDIETDRAARFKKGVELLTESAAHAEKYNPAYRERIKNRKPLDMLEEGELPKTSPQR